MNSPAAVDRPLARFFNSSTAGLVLIGLVLLCYARTLNFGYIWDDDQYVTDNPAIRTFAGLSRIWTDINASPQYYPVTLTSFWAEYQLLGQRFNPAISHAVNFALQACSVMLLFQLLRALRIPGAWLAAAIFAVHPLNVESVTWITERKNTLSLALGLAATHLYLRYRGFIRVEAAEPVADEEDEGIRFKLPTEPGRLYALFLVLFVLALLSKTTMAVLPPALVLILWWKRGRLLKADVLPLIVPLVLGIAAGMLTSYIERSPRHVGATGPEWDYGISRFALFGQTAWFYVGKLLLPHPFVFDPAKWSGSITSESFLTFRNTPDWLRGVLPWPLMFNYPRWTLDASNFRQWISTFGVVVALAGTLVVRRRFGYGPLVGVLLYLGCLLPASGLFSVLPMRFSYVADHFAYVAIIPLIVLLAASLSILTARVVTSEILPAIVTGIALLLLVIVTLVHSSAFENEEILWKATLLRNNESWLAAVNQGAIRIDAGRKQATALLADGKTKEAREELDKQLKTATAWLKAALKRNPTTYEAVYQLARIAMERGEYGDAITLARQSQEIAGRMQKDSFLQPRAMIAQLLVRAGKYDDAAKVYQDIAAFEPVFADKRPMFFATSRTDYGDLILSGISGPLSASMSQEDGVKVGNALDQYTRAIVMAPLLTTPKLRIARILVMIKAPAADALQQLQDVFSIDKENLEAQYLMATIALNNHEYEVAGAQLMKMKEKQPRYLPPYVKLAEALDAKDRRPEALAVLEEALKLQPNYKPALEAKSKMTGIPLPTTQPSTQSSTQPANAPTALTLPTP